MIYLDYTAQAPVETEVLELFYDTAKKYYVNPNSSHRLGLEAKMMIDQCSKEIADNLHILPEEIIYTSGATESNNLAIKGICERYKAYGKHILISSLEHNSIVASALRMQDMGFEVELLSVNQDGLVDIQTLKNKIREDTILVSICSVDSEIGLRQPIEEIGKFLKDYPHCYFHTDASQAFGKIPIDFQDVDLVTVTPHKFYGLNGFGILVKKKTVSLKPQMDGGKSTTVFRSGTPDLANIVACNKTLDIACKNLVERYAYVTNLSDYLKSRLKNYKAVCMNSTIHSVPYIVNFSLCGIRATELQKKLEDNAIYVSTKTSCCPIETPSKLVYALTKDKGLANSSIRISISHLTKQEEIDEFLRVFDFIYKEYEKSGKI